MILKTMDEIPKNKIIATCLEGLRYYPELEIICSSTKEINNSGKVLNQ